MTNTLKPLYVKYQNIEKIITHPNILIELLKELVVDDEDRYAVSYYHAAGAFEGHAFATKSLKELLVLSKNSPDIRKRAAKHFLNHWSWASGYLMTMAVILSKCRHPIFAKGVCKSHTSLPYFEDLIGLKVETILEWANQYKTVP